MINVNSKMHPQVFISYSSSKKEWVENLSTRLLADGVYTKVDILNLDYGNDVNVFMESIVNDKTIDYVLMICDKTYADKADARKGGVGSEAIIISSEIYGKIKQNKYIPVLVERDGDGKPYLPLFLKSCRFIDFSEEKEFETKYKELLRHIYKKSNSNKPQLGEQPKWLNDETEEKIMLNNSNSSNANKDNIFVDDVINESNKLKLNQIQNYGRELGQKEQTLRIAKKILEHNFRLHFSQLGQQSAIHNTFDESETGYCQLVSDYNELITEINLFCGSNIQPKFFYPKFDEDTGEINYDE